VAIKNGFDMSSLGGMDVNIWKQLLANQDVPTEELQSMLDKINAFLKENGIKLQFGLNGKTGEVKENKKTEDSGVKEFQKTLGNINQLTGGVNSIVGGIQQLGIDLPKGFQDVLGGIQGVMSILTGITTIIIAIQALTASNTAASWTDALIPFRNGGIVPAFKEGGIVPAFKTGGIVPHAAIGYEVPGHDYSDSTPVMVSSGELILNRSQQGNLASQLEQARQESYSGGDGTPYVQGELIYLGVNNFLKRSGRGEIVTSKKG
jgi:hypothetical protein